MEKKEWFYAWFDTSYYHLLYKHRNDEEARIFIESLSKKLKLPKGAHVLDLACGKGRHSLMLHKAGLNVLGVDLSSNSIASAQKNTSNHLRFAVHDMREIIPNERFDAVFNLFTSFGYFDTTEENNRVIESIYEMLSIKGIFVIDFMNCRKSINILVLSEEKKIDNIHFSIRRKFDGKHIYKYINVMDGTKKIAFMERIQALFLADFQQLFKDKFTIKNVFGDYKLNPFIAEESDRLIIIAERK
ncbi:MAG: class I SAM-dependent methyltransferase [Bacteroidetes bacterium]|nr:class I SAM-dependent methyltransferase [Bacteroidota bacterium]